MATAEGIPPGDHLLTFESSYDGSKQPYRLHVPTAAGKGEALPLAVVLHGKGVDHNAWFEYTPVQEHAEKRGYVVAAPHGRGNLFYRGPAEQDVLDVIETVKQKCRIDPDRVYLMGHSMGGWGTWWIGLRHPDQFAAISPMAGMAPIELLPNARHLAPLIIHDKDDDVVSVERSREPARELARLGIAHEYREEQGYGHASRLIGDSLPRVFDWFGEHKRAMRPTRIEFATHTPAAGRAHWLRILETDEFPKLARAKAGAETPGRVALNVTGVRRVAVQLDALPGAGAAPIELTINNSTFSAAHPSGWAVLTRDVKRDRWEMSHAAAAALPAYRSPIIGEVSADRHEREEEAWATAAVADILMKESGADLCLLHDDMFWLPGGPLSADALLDGVLYPDDRLGLFACDGTRIARVLTLNGTHLQSYPPGRVVEEKTTYRAVAPFWLANRCDASVQPLPQTITEYLFAHVRRTKTFP